jgi:hypothetical protein
MLPDAELQGFRLLVVAMVISGSSSGSSPSLDHRYASDAQLLRPTSIIFLRKVTEEVTLWRTCKRSATSATRLKRGTKTASEVDSSSYRKGLKNDRF